MSTIVVVRHGATAAIASDSLFSAGSTKISARHRANDHKIHRFQDTCIGFTGWSLFHNIFEAVMERYPGDLDFRSRRHVFETFQKLHRHLKEDFFLETDEEKDQPVESSQWNCVIAAPSGIFQVESDRGVYEYDTFWAIGSGSRLALGALHALYDRSEDAGAIARAAVEAACEFDNASGLPVQLFTVPLQISASSSAK